MYKIYPNLWRNLYGYVQERLRIVTPHSRESNHVAIKKWIMRIQITVLLLLLGLVQLSAKTAAQELTLKQSNVSLERVFLEIRKQTGHNVFFEDQNLNTSQRVNANFNHTPLNEVMTDLLKDTKLTFSITDQTIVIKPKQLLALDLLKSLFVNIDIEGYVTDKSGQPLIGATVQVIDHKNILTDQSGRFRFTNVVPGAIVKVSFMGYVAQEQPAKKGRMLFMLSPSESKLDEVQIMAYGTTSRRLATGNITKIKGDVVQNTPASNPMLALQGRVPGVIVTPSNGHPGATVEIQVRGRTQLDFNTSAAETPLYVIDGVPVAGSESRLNMLTSAIGGASGRNSGLSPLSTISSADIESIEILKDADATAIYGSRGASGVVLITTKRAKSGATNVNARFGTGITKVPVPKLLNTQQYVAMRKEAFKNDGIAMTTANAYDILLWDTTRNTNIAKELLGGTGHFTNGDVSLSGGTVSTQYGVTASYTNEKDIYPGAKPNRTIAVSSNLSGKILRDRLSYHLRGNYTESKFQSISNDFSIAAITLPPNYKLYNEDGSLAWNEGGISGTDNPLSYLTKTYLANTSSIRGTAGLSYEVTNGLSLKANIGYNKILTSELVNRPRSSFNPLSSSATNESEFGDKVVQSASFDPYLNYKVMLGKGKLDLTAGGSLQSQHQEGSKFTIRGYANEALMGSLIGISSTNFSNPSSLETSYKYLSTFGRATYNYDDTYIVNISGNRDGSSRFGPNYKFSTFGAIGATWLFTNLKPFKDSKILSFGKIKASYGTTGNDKIGDYQYSPLYGGTLAGGTTYLDSMALVPKSFFKPDLHWELTKKLEFGTELQFLDGRLQLSAAWFRNNTSDALVNYPLPTMTGFATVAANLKDVVIQNKGWELALTTENVKRKDFSWATSISFTIPKNRLLKYPNLAESTYSNQFVIGKSLSTLYLANFLGVDPNTGWWTVQDINNSGTFDIVGADMIPRIDLEPDFFGGLENTFRYKNLSLSILFDFTKGYTSSWMSALGIAPGTIRNMPLEVLNRWQQPGQLTNVQKFTSVSTVNFTSLTGFTATSMSTGYYNNVFRSALRNLNVDYSLPSALSKSIGLKSTSIYVQGQNLFSFAIGGDDPLKFANAKLAAMKTYIVGLKVGL